MTRREQFNRVDHDSNPSRSMTLTACPVGLVPPLPSGPLLLVLVLFFLFSNGCHIGGVGRGILKVGTLSFFAYLIIVITAHACGGGGNLP